MEMRNILKRFPGITANDHISIGLRKGEILALLGENGAGKSTLMSILFGLYQPDGGEILIRGKRENITGPLKAGELGIGMVHQHFKLVHNFTVTENIILGQEPWKGLGMDLESAAREVARISKLYGLDVDPWAKIEDISVGMQQRVEILKMLYRKAEVLIFDEPTAVLTPQEIQDLIQIIKTLVKEGKSVILITHKLKEIKAVADRCTVIRRGKVVGTVDVASTTEAGMAEMMVGRQVMFSVEKSEHQAGGPALVLDNLTIMSNRKCAAVKDFSLEVRYGEILGLAGVEGNGQTELVEAITGLRKVHSGKVLLKGEDITHHPVRPRLERGLAHIPEDRQKRGLVLDYTLGENFILETYYQEPYSRWGLLDFKAMAAQAKKIIDLFDVRSGEGEKSLARGLSGGNQQKAIVGREMDRNPEVLIAVQPTRGLDVGAIEYIHKRLVEQRDQGKAVLLVSLELDEILDLSDRIAVISHGELVELVNARDTDEFEIGLRMTGVRKGETA